MQDGKVEVRELMETSLQKSYEEWNEMKDGDENKPKKLNEIKTLAEVMNNYDKTNQERLNDNAKNSIDEARIKIEEAKVKNDHKRIVLGWGEIGIGLTFGALINFANFILSENMQADKGLQRFADNCYNWITKPFGKH